MKSKEAVAIAYLFTSRLHHLVHQVLQVIRPWAAHSPLWLPRAQAAQRLEHPVHPLDDDAHVHQMAQLFRRTKTFFYAYNSKEKVYITYASAEFPEYTRSVFFGISISSTMTSIIHSWPRYLPSVSYQHIIAPSVHVSTICSITKPRIP